MSYFDNTKHIRKFGGEIYYISKTTGSDSDSGLTPDSAFETIGQGIASMSNGDALSVMAGT